MNTSQHVVVDGADVVELIEILEFCTEWFDTDHNQLDHSLRRFAPQMSLSALQHDLCRLADQLGAAHLVTTHSQNGARP